MKWTSPVTNRLLLETGFSAVQFPTEFGTPLPGIVNPVGTPEWYAGALRRDLVLNTFVGQSNFSGQFAEQPSYAVVKLGVVCDRLAYREGRSAVPACEQRQLGTGRQRPPHPAVPERTAQFRAGVCRPSQREHQY